MPAPTMMVGDGWGRLPNLRPIGNRRSEVAEDLWAAGGEAGRVARVRQAD
jgi:hypothetical protein